MNLPSVELEVFILASVELERVQYWIGASRVSITSLGEGAFLALVGHPSSDGAQ